MTNAIDPKKDPARRCLKEEAWPALDRQAWHAALRKGDIFDERKAGDGWKASTRGKVAKAYGRWLTWLPAVRASGRGAEAGRAGDAYQCRTVHRGPANGGQ